MEREKNNSVMCRPELVTGSQRGQILCVGEPEAPWLFVETLPSIRWIKICRRGDWTCLCRKSFSFCCPSEDHRHSGEEERGEGKAVHYMEKNLIPLFSYQHGC